MAADVDRHTLQRQCYRLSRELRRCCWYGIFGFLGLAIVFVEVSLYTQKLDPAAPRLDSAEVVSRCSLFLVLAASLCVPLRWRLCVGEQGIEQSVLRSGDWTWADLASGRIRKTPSGNLADPARRWWRRFLWLSALSADDFRHVVEIVNQHYRRPESRPAPDALTLRYDFRRRAVFDSTGVHLMIKGVPHEYRWDEVEDVHITRLDPERRDFLHLDLALPDREIEFRFVSHQGGTTPTWRGATTEQINELLHAHVSEENITVSIRGELPAKRRHVEKALARLRARHRSLFRCVSIFGPLLIGTLVWVGVDDGIFKAAALTVVSLIPLGSILAFIFIQYRWDVSALEKCLSDCDLEASAR